MKNATNIKNELRSRKATHHYVKKTNTVRPNRIYSYMDNFTAKNEKEYIRITSRLFEGVLTISKGNKKVQFPILSVSSAHRCANAHNGRCPYSKFNKKSSSKTTCYAQKLEILRPSNIVSRDRNENFISDMYRYATDYALQELTDLLIDAVKQFTDSDILRLNESGDLHVTNIQLIEFIAKSAEERGVKVYTYSHSSKALQKRATDAGVTIQKSDTDFIVVKNAEEAIEKSLPLCGGTCGAGICTLCPQNIKVAVISH